MTVAGKRLSQLLDMSRAMTSFSPSDSSGTTAGIWSSALARVLVLPVAGACSLGGARLITHDYGIEVFSAYALVASLLFLLPVSDLGFGAAVTNAASKMEEDPSGFVGCLRFAQNRLRLFAIVGIFVTIVAGFAGIWPTILGLERHAWSVWGPSAAIVVFFVTMPLALWTRILIGLRRNAVAVFAQGIGGIATVAVIGVTALSNLSPLFLLLAPAVAVPAGNLTSMMIAKQDSRVRTAMGAALDGSGRSSERMAASAFIVTAILPVITQTDRLVLSNVSNLEEVAAYSAVALIYAPAVSISQLASRSLWGEFASVRGDSKSERVLLNRGLIVCSAMGAIIGLSLVVLGPYVTRLAVGTTLDLPPGLFISFGLLVFVQSIIGVFGMYLTDARGFRLQAWCVCFTAIGSVGLGVELCERLGAIGAVISSIVALVLIFLLPIGVESARRLYFTRVESFSRENWED
ncbi:lipopolysaccharide biosynthesis protein [Gordonia polyisoprenivorans]|uniref:lipopolysaccharide biosynthesis protein n=1 Tax=Gordonia polyisoprenivorans TaxID=84595 RepID=UPI0022FFD345|nr:hypothetical protein [Gordonia polyisoprenivorans]WCB38600.1 hypothetical protein PHA63_05480 [Gordonia polyisoprenivorans]